MFYKYGKSTCNFLGLFINLVFLSFPFFFFYFFVWGGGAGGGGLLQNNYFTCAYWIRMIIANAALSALVE